MYTPFIRRWRLVRPPRRFEWTLLCCALKSVPFLPGLCQVLACRAQPIPASPISSLAPIYSGPLSSTAFVHLSADYLSVLPRSFTGLLGLRVYSGVGVEINARRFCVSKVIGTIKSSKNVDKSKEDKIRYHLYNTHRTSISHSHAGVSSIYLPCPLGAYPLFPFTSFLTHYLSGHAIY